MSLKQVKTVKTFSKKSVLSEVSLQEFFLEIYENLTIQHTFHKFSRRT